MQRIHIIILVSVLALTSVVSGVVFIVGGSGYEQGTPVETATSFIEAMLEGDSEALTALTKDVIPWYYLPSELLGYATREMSGYVLGNYYYYQEGSAVVVYNKSKTPSPEPLDFFCFDFVRADGKFYITELERPGSYHGYHKATNASDWDEICQRAIENGCKKMK